MYKRPERHEAVENIQHAQQRAVQVNRFFQMPHLGDLHHPGLEHLLNSHIVTHTHCLVLYLHVLYEYIHLSQTALD